MGQRQMGIENVPVATTVNLSPGHKEFRIGRQAIGEVWQFRGKWHWVWNDLETEEQVLEGAAIDGVIDYTIAVENLVRNFRERN